ncbi:MAG TPA: tetratricopeptide repeat protein, partial [Chroococcales cyanobacterium]
RLMTEPYRTWTRRFVWGAFIIWGVILLSKSVPYYVYFDLGISAFAKGDFLKAEDLLTEAMRECGSFGDSDRRYKNCALVLANLYSNQCRYRQAEKLYNEVLRYYLRRNNPDTREVADVLEDRAFACLREQKLPEAKKLLSDALSIRQKLDGIGKPSTAVAIHALAQVSQLSGDFKQAGELYNQAASIWTRAGSRFSSQLKACYFDLYMLSLAEKNGDSAGRYKNLCTAVAAKPPRDLRRQVMHLAFLLVSQLMASNAETAAANQQQVEKEEVVPSGLSYLRACKLLPLEGSRDTQKILIEYAFEGEPDETGYLPVALVGRRFRFPSGQPMVSEQFAFNLEIGVNPMSLRPVVAKIDGGLRHKLKPVRRVGGKRTAN